MRIKKIYFLIGGVFFFSAGMALGTFAFFLRGLPPTSVLQDYTPKQGTKLYDSNGELIYEFCEERRILVPLSKIPLSMINATIAIEDRQFRRHWGINLFAILRAAWVNFRHHKIRQGASTITQQLARNLFLTQERTISRKIKEALLALKIERVYSKDEILALYFNQIYFGSGAYGAEAAAQVFLGKHVEDLTLAEAALLAGLPRAPSIYSPYDRPQTALNRRNTVLEAMVEIGAVTKKEAEMAKNASLNLHPRQLRLNDAPYFVEEIRKILESRYGANLLYQGGMSVYTTLDLRYQRMANAALENWLSKIEKEYGFKIKREDVHLSPREADVTGKTPYLQGALVAIDPQSGEIKAMIGGRDFFQSKFNRATQAKRQAGSAFKPFLYTAAMDNGFTPADVILDAPIILTDDGSGESWTPMNYDESFEGSIPLRRALALSKNLPAVRLMQKVGPTTVTNYARKMGIKSPLPAVLSLSLGSADVSLLEMTSSFGVIANQGIEAEPLYIKKVIDRNGNVLEENHSYLEEVLNPRTAYIMANLMQTVIDAGTAVRARSLGFSRPAAGKTGTTNEYTDCWFIGFTPDLVCGVWVGFDEKKTIAKGATGAGLALPIWVDFMKASLAGRPVRDFPIPDGIIIKNVCLESGLLATEACPKTHAEVFIAGTEPTRPCDVHRLQELNVKGRDFHFEDLDRKTLQSPDFELPKP
ncbi:MAG: PBP1A family penicillin-binding protein [Candidatus Edwardsbacteria bacterium]